MARRTGLPKPSAVSNIKPATGVIGQPSPWLVANPSPAEAGDENHVAAPKRHPKSGDSIGLPAQSIPGDICKTAVTVKIREAITIIHVFEFRSFRGCDGLHGLRIFLLENAVAIGGPIIEIIQLGSFIHV